MLCPKLLLFSTCFISFNYITLSISLGVPASRRAFRSIFAPLRSAKDAASIPNALEAANSKSRALNNNSYLDA
jgi:hypothetical protein